MQVEIGSKKRRADIDQIDKKSRLAKLKKRNIIKGDPESIVHIDWSGEWKPLVGGGERDSADF